MYKSCLCAFCVRRDVKEYLTFHSFVFFGFNDLISSMKAERVADELHYKLRALGGFKGC